MKLRITIILLCVAILITTLLTWLHHPKQQSHTESPTIAITQPLEHTLPEPLPKPEIPECPPTTTPEEQPIEPITTFAPFTSYVYNGTRLRMPLSAELQEYTYQMSLKYDVPYRVIMGLMGAESGWQADIGEKANGNATYVGLGMLRDIYYADRYAAKGIDIYTPKGNIEAICDSIRSKMDAFDNNITYALMAYNLGNGGAKSKIASGVHETRYTRVIMAYAESLV